LDPGEHISCDEQLFGIEVDAGKFSPDIIEGIGGVVLLFIKVIIGVVPGADVEIELQVLYFFQFLPFFPYFNKDVGNDLFSGFFCFYQGFGEMEQVGIEGCEQFFIGLLVIKAGNFSLQVLNGSSGNHLAKQ